SLVERRAEHIAVFTDLLDIGVEFRPVFVDDERTRAEGEPASLTMPKTSSFPARRAIVRGDTVAGFRFSRDRLSLCGRIERGNEVISAEADAEQHGRECSNPQVDVIPSNRGVTAHFGG